MGLEAASWIDDLVITNPPGGDTKRQGDDHLRLIKTVLKACFPNATKAFYFPNTASKTANFTVVAADMHKTFYVDTAAGEVTATLPTLAAGDAGWECHFLKTNAGSNASFIAPASGTLQSGEVAGLAKCRRCIPGHRSTARWSGSAWFVSRVPSLPVGTAIESQLSSPPVGYEWVRGQTLTDAANKYPEFYVANGNSGLVLDQRGRVGIGRDDMGGTAAGRVGNVIVGTSVGNTGGGERNTLEIVNLPVIDLDNYMNQTPHDHSIGSGTTSGSGGVGVGPGGTTVPQGAITTNIDPANANISWTSFGSATPVSNVQPSIIVNKLMIVE